MVKSCALLLTVEEGFEPFDLAIDIPSTCSLGGLFPSNRNTSFFATLTNTASLLVLCYPVDDRNNTY